MQSLLQPPSKLALFTRTKPLDFNADSEYSFFDATMKPYLASFLSSETTDVTHLSTFNLGDTGSGKSFTFRGTSGTGLVYQTLKMTQEIIKRVTVHEINGKEVDGLFEVGDC